MFKYKDLTVGISSVLLGILIILQSKGLVAKTSMDPAGPAALPLLMAWTMIVLGVVEAAGGFIAGKARKKPAESVGKIAGFFARYRLSILVMILGAAFCALFNLLGFIIVMPLFYAAVLWVLGKRDVKSLVVTNLVFNLILFVLFKFALSVDLPLGPFESLF